jgi:ATP-binding cassette subfamily B protein
MQYLNLFTKYSQILLRSLPLIWQAAPKEVAFITFTVLIRGIFPGFSIWINKQIVDAVASGLNSQQLDNYQSLFSLVIAWVGAILLQSILEPFYDASLRNTTEKLAAHINLLILHKANSLVMAVNICSIS